MVVAWVILEPPESGLVYPIDLNISIMFSELWKMLVRGIGQTAPVPARGCNGVEKQEGQEGYEVRSRGYEKVRK